MFMPPHSKEKLHLGMEPLNIYRLNVNQFSLQLHIFQFYYIFLIESLCQNLPEPDNLILVYLYKVMTTVGQKCYSSHEFI